MKDLTNKISTRAEVKIKLREFAESKKEFTTKEAVDMILEESSNVFINNNRIAQYLRGAETHEFNKSLKRWIKIRK